MENILEFIKEQKIIYLATIDGDQARVRPINGLTEINGKLVWCTNNQKEMFKQVIASPKVEVCMFGKGKTARVFGTCLPTKDAAIKAKYLELQPGVAKLYGGKGGTLEIMVFEDATVKISGGSRRDVVKLY